MKARFAQGLLLLFVWASHAQAQNILALQLPANAIRFSKSTGLLYATVPSSAGLPYGNSVVEISPTDATITRSVWVGSEPTALAISPDAAVAYVGLSGAAAVRVVDLDQMIAQDQFTLGTSIFFGPFFPEELAVMPGHPETVAVSRRNMGFSPRFEGVAVYDNGVMRPTDSSGAAVASNSIAFGADPNILFGLDTQDTAGSLSRMSISASGVTVLTSVTTPFAALTIKADRDTVFGDYGDVADGQSLQTVGHYAASGAEVIFEPTHSIVFAKGNAIQVFNRYSYAVAQPVLNIFWEYGSAKSAAACGLDCVAVGYDSGDILVITGYNDVVFAENFD
jgi:hypothetical protein